MINNVEITPLSDTFDYSCVPSWYVICTNISCPLKDKCLRYLTGLNTPDVIDHANCVLPKALENGQCRWFDPQKVVVNALGFIHLYDRVMKKDFTRMRKEVTRYLHGAKLYYEYKDGKRPLSPEQQQWIRNYVKSCGYDWEVEFDHYFEAYVFNHVKLKAG